MHDYVYTAPLCSARLPRLALQHAPLPGALFSDDDFHAMMRCSLPLPGRFGSGDRFGDENAAAGEGYGACVHRGMW